MTHSNDIEFVKNISNLIQEFSNDSFVPKLHYLTSNILTISLIQGRICDIDVQLLPKLFALEHNELYNNILKLGLNTEECKQLYKNSIFNNYLYDEFLFISLTFLRFIFISVNQLDGVQFVHNFKDKTIRILSEKSLEYIQNNHIDLNNIEPEFLGRIGLNATIH